MNFHEVVSLLTLSFGLLSLVLGVFLSETIVNGFNNNAIFFSGFGLFVILSLSSMVFYGIGSR